MANTTIRVTDLTGSKPHSYSLAPQPQYPQIAGRATRPTTSLPTGNKNAYASKLDHCKDIYRVNKLSGRQAVIMLFVSIAGCTPAGASSYYQTIKKMYG